MKKSFRQDFLEQLEALRIRLQNLVPTESWRDMMGAAHDRAFVVAGAMEIDLLSDLAAAVEDAIKGGLGIDTFRLRFDQIVSESGWDYTGERGWRTRTIYSTNIRTSYSAGRLAQLRDPALQAVAPYWMYRHGGSPEPRPQHLEWDGLTLPADHPWWDTHYTPNGFGCSCYVIAVDRETAERMGGRFEEPPPGLDGVDEGWDYMPGDSVEEDVRRIR